MSKLTKVRNAMACYEKLIATQNNRNMKKSRDLRVEEMAKLMTNFVSFVKPVRFCPGNLLGGFR